MANHAIGICLMTSGLVGAVIGCSGPMSPATRDSPKSPTLEHSSHDAHDEAASQARVQANLAKLPDTDRVLAEKQHVCPVSDEHLGSMGVPLKVLVKGQTVLICCESCREALTDNPDKYLAKLKEHGTSHSHE